MADTKTTFGHPALDAVAEDLERASARSNGRLELGLLGSLTQLNLRLDPSGPGAAAAESVLGYGLPSVPDSVSGDLGPGGTAVVWLGPDEWLVLAPASEGGLEQRLRTALADVTASVVDVAASVVDVSVQRRVLTVAGPDARALLSHGCSLDLHPLRFRTGQCARTMLAHAQVLLVAGAVEQPSYWIFVRASFFGYLSQWLVDAATEYR
jgi:sarcosine oxidase subunit gamma